MNPHYLLAAPAILAPSRELLVAGAVERIRHRRIRDVGVGLDFARAGGEQGGGAPRQQVVDITVPALLRQLAATHTANADWENFTGVREIPRKWSSELPEKPDVVLIEPADVINAVPPHAEPLHSQAEGN